MRNPLRRNHTGTIETYRDTTGFYRYRLKAANGDVISTPTQGYTSRWSAKRGAHRARTAMERPRWVDLP